MDFGPGLNESLLGPRQIATNAFDWIESEHGLGILICSMKVWPVVRSADFNEHPNDDSEESRNLRHRSMCNLPRAFQPRRAHGRTARRRRQTLVSRSLAFRDRRTGNGRKTTARGLNCR